MVKLRTLLETIETTPVNIGFLKKRVSKTVSVLAYEQLKGQHRSKLFKGKTAVIVLIPKKGSKRGHFICLVPRPRHIEYFSSLGNNFETELAQLDEHVNLFRTLLGKNYIYNKVKLQSGRYNINTCAAWVLARARLAHLKLRGFQEIFGRISLQNPDDIVSMLVLLDFVDKE